MNKRSFNELDQSLTMANCLMLLSRGNENNYESSIPDRVFACKTCGRTFSSFQALGGHRASHKKPRLSGGDLSGSDSQSSTSPSKPKTHECNICGLEFAIGQALGGHMRRHRASNVTNNVHLDSNGSESKHTMMKGFDSNLGVVPVLKKSNSSRRVMCLDLNLTPFENDMKILGIGTITTPPLVEFIF